MTRLRLAAALLLLALLAGIGAMLTSETVLRWAVAAAVRQVPQLEVSGVEGRLLTGIAVERVQWQSAKGLTIVVESAEARWRALPALAGRLHVPRIDAAVVVLRLPVTAPGAGPVTRRMPPDVDSPVNLRIAGLHVGRFELHRGNTRLAYLDDVHGDTLSMTGHEIVIGGLTARGAPVGLELSGEILARGDWPLDATAEWRLELDDRPAVDAVTRLSGSLRRLAITQSLRSGAGTVVLDGVVDDAVTAPDFTGTVRVQDLQAARLREGWPELDADGELALDGWIEDLAASGDLHIRLPGLPVVRMQLRADWGQSLLVVRELALRLEDGPSRLRTNGRVDWSGAGPRARAVVDWTSLQWPPAGDTPLGSARGTARFNSDDGRVTAEIDAQAGARDDGRVEARIEGDWRADAGGPRGRAQVTWRAFEMDGFASLHGEVDVQGSAGGWQGSLSAGFTAAGITGLQATFDFEGDADGARVSSLRLDTPGGEVRGEIGIDWRERLHVVVSARTDALDTGRLSADWPGRLSASLDGEATLGPDDAVAWQLHALDADGSLRGRPLHARASAHGRNAALSHANISVDAGGAALRVQARSKPDFAVDWTLDAPELSALLPGASGRMRSEGALRGGRADPVVDMTIDATALQWREQALDSLDIRVSGRSDAMRIEATAARAPLSAALTAEGAWSGEAYTATLQDASFTYLEDDTWTLAGPAGFSAGAAAAHLDRACWRQRDSAGSVCVSGHWNADTDAGARATLAGLPLEALNAWLPAGVDYRGQLSGDASLEWTAGDWPVFSGTLGIDAGDLQQTARDERVTLLAWREAAIQGAFSEGTLDANFEFSLMDGGELRGGLNIPVLDTDAGDTGSRPMHARITGEFSDFDLVPALFPEIGSVSGQVRVDLVANGTLRDPLIGGTLGIADGTATIPRLGVRLTGMRLAIDASRDSVNLAASARSGPGELAAEGRVSVRDGKATGSGTLTGEEFEVANVPEARVLVSPRAEVTFDGHDVHVDGEVRIPRSRIEPRDFSAAVSPTSDQVLVDDAGDDVPAERWRTSARIRMVLGDDVHFDGFGLHGRIAGNLTVSDEPGEITRASGELNIVEGRYRAWGQELEIERGRLLYTGGPVTQPGLDIRAVRHPQNVLVGANIRGTLAEPEMSIFSEPPMPQSEALSWLVLGQPMTQAGGSEQELLDRTSDQLGLAGGELLLGEMTRRLGIGGVGIERGETPDDVTLMIGRYLSPRLYIAYGIGLFEPGNTARLRYQLDRNWSIEAESGPRASGTDLLYTIERD